MPGKHSPGICPKELDNKNELQLIGVLPGGSISHCCSSFFYGSFVYLTSFTQAVRMDQK